MTKNDSVILEVADIGQVDTPTLHTNFTIYNNKIIAIMELSNDKTCLRCSARVEPATPPFGRCSKTTCNMSQLYDCCPDQLTAKLLFMTKEPAQHTQRMITLALPGSLLRELTHPKEVTERNLLSLPQIKQVTYYENNIALSIIIQ